MNQVTTLRQTGVVSSSDSAMTALVLFMTSELLPDMIFNWPNGAKRIEDNLQGAAQSYARQLSGRDFTAALIRKALQAEMDSDRDFMPTPRELAARCKELMIAAGNGTGRSARHVASWRSIELRVESQLYQDNQAITAHAIEQGAQALAATLRSQGIEIAGGDW